MREGKKARKDRALKRDEERLGRTPEQQLKLLDRRAPRGAKKERARLNALIAKKFEKDEDKKGKRS